MNKEQDVWNKISREGPHIWDDLTIKESAEIVDVGANEAGRGERALIVEIAEVQSPIEEFPKLFLVTKILDTSYSTKNDNDIS